MRMSGLQFDISLLNTTGFNPAITPAAPPPPPPPPPPRFSLTFYINTSNTPGNLNSDGNFYNIQFPYDFIVWDGGESGTAGETPTILSDPFADYRAAGNDTHTYTPWTYTDAFGESFKRMPPISANLDITIIVENGTNVGSNTIVLGAAGPIPSFQILTGDLGTTAAPNPEANQAFIQDSSANLYVIIKNSGNVAGGGGIGGQGKTRFDGKNNQSGGGGGGGAGLHPINPTAGTVAPGAGGAGQGGGSVGAAGTYLLGGDGGTGGLGGATVRNATSGSIGGSVFAIINRAYYTASNTAYGPRAILQNESDGFMQAGAGGGGGGGVTTQTPGTGGDGGDIGGGGGTDGTQGEPGSGTIGGVINTMSFGLFSPASGGRLLITNANPIAGSVKDNTGTY